MNKISKLKRVPLREVWQHEAYDFSVWLENNIDILGDLLGLELVNPEREKSAGSFSVDIIAEDAENNSVVIENQLEKSDHDHLGKLITYIAVFQAKIAIWIVAHPRAEHIQAITWLNESLNTSFYLIKVEAVRIEDSAPAPLLTLIVAPTQESKNIGITKRARADQDTLIKHFWTNLLEVVTRKTNLHGNVSPSHKYWLSTGAGKTGIKFQYIIKKDCSAVQLYINQGSSQKNLEIFDQLSQAKDTIESQFGDTLEWQSLDGKKSCRITKTFQTGGYQNDESEWEKIQIQMVDAMIQLEKAFRPWINNISSPNTESGMTP